MALVMLSLCAWCVWKAARTAAVEFDLVRRCVRRGTDRPVPFSEIGSIVIAERWNDGGGIVSYFYTVTLRLSNGHKLRLGQAESVEEATAVAERIATLVGKPIVSD